MKAEGEVAEKRLRSRLCKKSTQQTEDFNTHIYHRNRMGGLVKRRLSILDVTFSFQHKDCTKHIVSLGLG